MLKSEDFSNHAVLVTGVGGVTGQGILQCLLNIDLRPIIIATDISKTAAGLYWADKSFVLPNSSKKRKYLDAIKFICENYDISTVFPGSDGEARVLSNDNSWKSNDKIVLATASKNVWQVTGDKFKTFLMAKKLDIYSPMTKRFSSAGFKQIVEQYGIPIVFKPRKGSASRGIYYICKFEEIPRELNLSSYIIQEFLGTESIEYTVGAYFSKSNYTGTPNALVAMRRKLLNGNTSFGEVISAEVFEKEIRKIAKHLKIEGYCNFQFISRRNQFYLIEINARFSSSISISEKAGCNFVELYLLDYLKNVVRPPFRSSSGRTVVRYVNDYVFDTDDAKNIEDLV